MANHAQAVTSKDEKPSRKSQLVNTLDASKWRGVARNTFISEWRDGVWPDPVLIRGKRYWVLKELEAALAAAPRDPAHAA